MDQKDFELVGRRVDRLTATKAVASDFIERREGDRIGLILFGERAYLQVPLTLDRETVNILLMEAFIGLAGEKTAIGDAITLAVRRVHEGDQVLVLLTDGANTAGEVQPLKAAQLAQQVGLRIYTIGIGAEQLEVSSLIGGRRRINPSADLDEATLTQIAQLTGGRYFRATDTASFGQPFKASRYSTCQRGANQCQLTSIGYALSGYTQYRCCLYWRYCWRVENSALAIGRQLSIPYSCRMCCLAIRVVAPTTAGGCWDSAA